MLSLVDINNRKREDLLCNYYFDLIVNRTVYDRDIQKIFTSFIFEGKIVTLSLLGLTFTATIKSETYEHYAFCSYNTVKHSLKHFHRAAKRFLDIMIRNKIIHKQDKLIKGNFHHFFIEEITFLIAEYDAIKSWKEEPIHIGICNLNGLRTLLT